MPFALNPHGDRKYDVGIFGRESGVDLVYDDKAVVYSAEFVLVAKEPREVRHGLRPVVMGAPNEVHVAFRHFAEDLHRVETGFLDFVQVAFRQVPDSFRKTSVLSIRNQQVGWQTVAEGADLSRGAASGRLAGERERSVAWLGNLAREQVQVVDVMVHPCAAVVLVYAHGPQRHDFRIGLGEDRRKLLQVLHRNAGEFRGVLEGVRRQAFCVLFERDAVDVVDRAARLGGVVVVLVRVADILRTGLELAVVGDERGIVEVVGDQVIGNAVCNRQVGARAENERLVRARGGARDDGAKVIVAHVTAVELAGCQARVEHRMCLCHVGAPGHEHVGMVDVIVAACRLVGLEHVHEGDHRACHAQACVRVDVVGTQACFPELGGQIAFGNGLLAGTPECEAGFVRFPGFAQFRRHKVQRLFPGRFAQAVGRAFRGGVVADERFGQTVFPVENLR